jgi:threonine synthase
VGINCAEKYIARNKSDKKMLAVSTASAYKFAGDVYYSLTGEKNGGARRLFEKTGVEIPEAIAGLDGKRVRFDNTVDAGGMKNYVMQKIADIK